MTSASADGYITLCGLSISTYPLIWLDLTVVKLEMGWRIQDAVHRRGETSAGCERFSSTYGETCSKVYGSSIFYGQTSKPLSIWRKLTLLEVLATMCDRTAGHHIPRGNPAGAVHPSF